MEMSEITVEKLKKMGYYGWEKQMLPNFTHGGSRTRKSEKPLEEIVYAVQHNIEVVIARVDISRVVKVQIKDNYHCRIYSWIERPMTEAGIFEAEINLNNQGIAVKRKGVEYE